MRAGSRECPLYEVMLRLLYRGLEGLYIPLLPQPPTPAYNWHIPMQGSLHARAPLIQRKHAHSALAAARFYLKRDQALASCSGSARRTGWLGGEEVGMKGKKAAKTTARQRLAARLGMSPGTAGTPGKSGQVRRKSWPLARGRITTTTLVDRCAFVVVSPRRLIVFMMV